MKLLEILNLQEPRDTEYVLAFTKHIKQMMKAKGWRKEDGIAVYGHGAGFFLEKARGSAKAEVEFARAEAVKHAERETKEAGAGAQKEAHDAKTGGIGKGKKK